LRKDARILLQKILHVQQQTLNFAWQSGAEGSPRLERRPAENRIFWLETGLTFDAPRGAAAEENNFDYRQNFFGMPRS
jgi:hypothetical protein